MRAPSLSSGIAPARTHEQETIRVLKFVTGFFTGGTELQVLKLAQGMDRRKFELSFSCLEKDGNHLGAYEALGAPISEFPIKRLYHPRTFLQQRRFAALLRSQKTQILHSYNFYANVFAVPAGRLAGVPVVLASVRDRGVYLTPAQKKLQRWVLGLADRILVNADSIRDWLVEQGLVEDRISVIRNGVDLSRYPEAPAHTGVRRTLGIPDSAPIVLLMARLNPLKGIEEFIRAAAMVNERHPEARFLIVGAAFRSTDGVIAESFEYRDELMQLAESLGMAGRIIFTGHRTDTPDLLAEADISVLPSHSEGLSNTLLESMAAGVPAIATDVGGNPELVREGVNGKLVPVKSPECLARAIGGLLANPEERKKLGDQARVMARDEFSLSGMVDRTERLYRSQLEHTKRSLAWR